MTPPEPQPATAPGSEQPDPGSRCAPIRQTAAEEIDGLYRFAVSRLGPRAHLAQDVVQQALWIALEHASPPQPRDTQCAWLRGVVKNVIRRELRSQHRRHAALERAAARTQRTPDPSTADDCATDDTRDRLIKQLFRAVAELNTADQDLFYAFYRAGRSHASIAAELGTTVKAVEARLYRLRARLRTIDPPAESTP